MKQQTDTQVIPIGDYTIRVDYTWYTENDGIGSYEFWGYRGYDSGREVMVVEEVEPVFVDETREEREEIISELNHNWEKYVEYIIEHHEREEGN